MIVDIDIRTEELLGFVRASIDMQLCLWNLRAAMAQNILDLPGYRRRIRIEARRENEGGGVVLAMLEDDLHCMAVTLRHDHGIVKSVEPVMARWPWNTCPGAQAQLIETFIGQPLAEVTARREKRANCTHLHDLAVLAGAHAFDEQSLVYDVLVSDPLDGERRIELRKNGEVLLHWLERNGVLVEPADAAGMSLPLLRNWIATLPLHKQEPARLLQWAAMVAHGRTIPLEEQSTASSMPANCYTFQPDRALGATRVGLTRDFSTNKNAPLDGHEADWIAKLGRNAAA